MSELAEGTYYEVMYNDCYGAFRLPLGFVTQVFETYPPDSEIGKDLWDAQKYANFIQTGGLINSEWKHYYEVIEKVPFKAGYFTAICKNMHREKDGTFKEWFDTVEYITKNDADYYSLSSYPNGFWRRSPHVIALAKTYGLFNKTTDESDEYESSKLALEKIPLGYNYRIRNYDGMESVEKKFPYNTVIQELLDYIKSPTDANSGPLTKKLLSGELVTSNI